MNDWYQRQFGSKGEFALLVSLGTDPHPSGSPDRDLCWGSLEIWSSGRCLTRSVYEGAVHHGVRWSLLPVLEWLAAVGLRLVNEDPYPRFSKGIDVPDGVAWFDGTLSPPMLTDDAERRWFLRRSEWRYHHALRSAAVDVALPNVVFRRIASRVEVSWDNETWSTSRRGLEFVERRGRALVSARSFAQVITDTLVDVLERLSERAEDGALRLLSERVAGATAGSRDWKWLVHRPTAALIRSGMPELAQRLDDDTRANSDGLYVPHTRETQILRLARLERQDEVEALLQSSRYLPTLPVQASLRALVSPRPVVSERPWEEGNAYAETVRDKFGWGSDPLPDLSGWMVGQGLAVPEQDLGLPSVISVFSERTEDVRALVYVNPRGAFHTKRETGLAMALGHVLLDEVPVAMDGDWEHWPTAARARAFGVALTLPEDGVRGFLGAKPTIDRGDIRGLMDHFGSGMLATAYRLKNLGLLSHDEMEVLTQ